MRTISTASLAKLAQKTGTEPVCIVEIESLARSYADKSVEGLDGRILSISQIDDILNVSKSATTQNVTITLDDADGAMKSIFDSIDLHNRRATIYQWFTGIPLADKFVMFSGIIVTPIIWKESDRTLTFTVISKTSDLEVGFSPEEGEFPNLPQNVVGQSWPIVFGTVMKMPLQRVDDIPNKDNSGDLAGATTTDEIGVEDPSIQPHLDDQDKNQGYAGQLAQVYFIGYLQASHTARELGELGDLDDIDKGKGTFSSLAKQYLAQGNKYLLEAQKIRRKSAALKTVLDKQKTYNKKGKSIGVTNGSAFPQNTSTNIVVGSIQMNGVFIGNDFLPATVTHPAAERYADIAPIEPDSGDPPVYIARDNFAYAPAGTPIGIATIAGGIPVFEYGVRYIVSSNTQVTVQVVYAWQTIGAVKQLTVVPSNYYQVFQVLFGTLPVTLLYLPTPLSSLTDSSGESLGWEDELWATCQSTVGPNTVDILEWLINNFTTHTYDATSFAQVRTYLAAYPSNFALRSRTNAITLIQDIAYQSRCIIWLKNNVFNIKYLARKSTPIDSITESDILEQSLEVSYTETEDIITKVKASWFADYFATKPNLVILRYNILFYGLHNKSDNYFTYNMQQLVEKSAVFWLIRTANTFKRVTCKVPISKLNIETLDTVTLNFTHHFIANTAIDCVVESAVVDTSDYTITLTLWCPVRSGEMTEYLFAYPADLTAEFVWPTTKDIELGRAGGGHTTGVSLPVTGNTKIDRPMTGEAGNGGSLHVTKRPLTYGPDPTYQADTENVAPEITTRIDSTKIISASAKPEGTTNYQLSKGVVKDTTLNTSLTTSSFPAKVVSGGPGTGPYVLSAYLEGTSKDPSNVAQATQLDIAIDETIAAGTWVIATRVVYTDNGATKVEWYFQTPVWK